MTKWEATRDLQEIMDKWIDFGLWAYLQLEMRGEWSQERMKEVLENHERAELRKNEYKTETLDQMQKLHDAGATKEEINSYSLSRQDELTKLVNAWRSLEGLAE